MNKALLVKDSYHFPGITVLVPRQETGQVLVAINKGSLFPKGDLPGDFHPIRKIANIALVPVEQLSQVKMVPANLRSEVSFDPPIEFRVGYNFQDVLEAGGDISSLRLAYSDGTEWVPITPEENEYQILPPATGQVAEFKIITWPDDPMIAWGK